MKKALALFLALLMLVTVFCSCNDGNDSETKADTETKAVEDSETEADTKEDKNDKKEPWKPGDPTEGDEGDEGDTPTELEVPTKAPNGKTMEIVPVMDGTWTKPFDAEAAAWASECTDKTLSVFDNNGTVNLNEYSGFLVRVKPNEVNNGIYLRFFLKMQDGTELEIKALGRNLNWYTLENGWTTIAGGETASNWKLPIGEEGYAYLEFPLSEVAAHSTSVVTDIKVGSYGTERSATFSEWSLVKGATTLKTPTALADGTKIELVSISDGTYTKDFTAKDQSYATELENATTNIFANGATVDLSQYRGFLVKKTPDNENGKGIYIRFKVKYADGTEQEIKAQNRELSWFNGSWDVAATASSNWKLTLDEEGYIFLDFSKFDELKDKVISDFCIYNSEADRSAKFSEWSFVKAVEGGESGDTPVEVKPEIPVLAVPDKLADGTPISVKPITDGVLEVPGTDNASGYASSLPFATINAFADGATIDLNNYKGLLLKVTTSEAKNFAGLYVRFFIKVPGAEEEIQIKANGRSLWYYNGTEWSEVTSGATATNWTTPTGAVGYIYLAFPLDEIAALESAVISDIRIYSSKSANRIGMFSDLYLVTKSVAAPTTLSDGTAITATKVTDGIFEVASKNNLSAWSTEFASSSSNIFDGGAKVDLSEYKGILIKATTYAEKNYAGIRFHFKFKLADGTTVTVKSAGRGYKWYNGESWKDVAGATSNWTTPNEESGYLYVAFPFDELESKVVTDIGIVSQSGANRFGNYSDFCLVK